MTAHPIVLSWNYHPRHRDMTVESTKLENKKVKILKLPQLCECNCRQFTNPGRRFISGHNAKGKNNPNYGKILIGENSRNWRGENVGYSGLHMYVRKYYPKPKACESCGKITTRLDLANITGIYNRDFSNWRYLCIKDHKILDNTIDMSNRQCSKCGSNDTYINKKNNTPSWCTDEEGNLYCKKCWSIYYHRLPEVKIKEKEYRDARKSISREYDKNEYLRTKIFRSLK